MHDKRAWINRAGDWKTYAAAAGATLAMAANANADIINSGSIDVTVSVPFSGSTYSVKYFQVNGYREGLTVRNVSIGVIHRADAGIFGSLFSLAVTSHKADLRRYGAGSPINGSHLAHAGLLRSAGGGAFGPGTVSGFVGFELPDGDLGWMQVKVSDRNSDGFTDEAEVIDYAYNNVPGGPINAGQIATPEPSAAALGLLTMGAAGLLAWRRRRAKVAAE